MSHKTTGEVLFEEYLTARGLDFAFEEACAGKAKRPDYRIQWKEQNVYLEVKDFGTPMPTSRVFALDIYKPIRNKIDAAKKKFAEFKDSCCGLVLFGGDSLVFLQEPNAVLGAMYGDLGWELPLNVDSDMALGEPTRAFLGYGKMIRYGRSEPQNRTISALITLTALQSNSQDERRIPRVIVWHNLVAKIKFPADLFCGPFDSHFGVVEANGKYFQEVTFRGSGLPETITL